MRARGTGTLQKDGRWKTVVVVTNTDGTKTRVPVYGHTQQECMDNRAVVMVADGRGTVEILTIGRIADLYESEKRKGTKEKTWDQYGPSLAKVRARWKDTRADKVTVAMVAAWLRKLYAEGAGATTVQKTRDMLGYVFKFGIENGLCFENPVQGIGLPASPKKAMIKRPRITDRTFEAILQAERSPVLADLWEFLDSTGLRVNEALVLHRRHVVRFMDLWWIRVVDAKTDAGIREVPLPDLLADRLIEREEWLFPDENSGVPAGHHRYTTVEPKWRATLELAGLEHTNIHQLRKHAITRWFAQGLGDDVVKMLAGHTDISIARNIYQRMGRDQLVEGVFAPWYIGSVSGADESHAPLGLG